MQKGLGCGEWSVCSNLTHRHPWDHHPFTWAVEHDQSTTPLVEETAAWRIHTHFMCAHACTCKHTRGNNALTSAHTSIHTYTHNTRTHILSHIYTNILTHIFIHTYAFTRKYVSSHTDFCTPLETRTC